MKASRTRLAPATRRLVTEVYGSLDYEALGAVYCYEGGDEFWRAKRGPCARLGSRVALLLRKKLRRGGRSLYVGAGVSELPALSPKSKPGARRQRVLIPPATPTTPTATSPAVQTAA